MFPLASEAPARVQGRSLVCGATVLGGWQREECRKVGLPSPLWVWLTAGLLLAHWLPLVAPGAVEHRDLLPEGPALEWAALGCPAQALLSSTPLRLQAFFRLEHC